jgi:hypothetical protein
MIPQILIKTEVATNCFYGSEELEPLSDFLLDKHGYEMDGVHYPANGATLQDYMKWVNEMSLADLRRFVDTENYI